MSEPSPWAVEHARLAMPDCDDPDIVRPCPACEGERERWTQPVAASLDAARAEGRREGRTEERPGYLALLRDCRGALATALRAAEIGAYPGPAWREQAAQLGQIIDIVTKEAP